MIMQIEGSSEFFEKTTSLPVISPLLAPGDHILRLLPAVTPVQQFWLSADRFQSVNLEGAAEF